ncbi:MAG: diheme cytochrome c-553, partial [Flavisolibacter sp.]|nr:diheme cytochrome c-553 [Flavisolibacter sp.]
MKHKSIYFSSLCIVAALLLSQCQNNDQPKVESIATTNYGGYESAEQWGEHLVTVSACHDCHSPKKMTPNGPEIDSSLLLSGHPSQMPDIGIDRKEMEQKGLGVTQDLTSWIGPWGISYTANLTSDASGIGNWTEGQFIYAIRNGKSKGMENSRTLLPPMPWQMYRNFSDNELKAIFAYLKSTKPIRNI